MSAKVPRHWPLWGEFTGDRWIPCTKGQWRGKCFHLMTSSWACPPFGSKTQPEPNWLIISSTFGNGFQWRLNQYSYIYIRECILKCRLCNVGHIFISKYDAIGAVCYGTSRPGFKVAAFAICNISPWWRHVTQKIALPALFENPSVTHKRPTMQKFVE